MSDLCVTWHKHDRKRLALPGLRLCSPCRDNLTDDIAALPGLYEQLAEQLTEATPSDRGTRGAGTIPLPINAGIVEHRDQIQHDLAWWAIYIADGRHISRPTASDPATTAAYLAEHAEWIAGHQAAAEQCPPVMASLAGRARGLIDPDRRLPTGERCRTVDDEGQRCDGTIRMVQGRDDQWRARCSHCGEQEAEPYLHDKVAGRWVTIERVQAYVLRVHGLRVARPTIRSWAARGNVAAMTEREATWYDLGSVQRYLTERAKVAS